MNKDKYKLNEDGLFDIYGYFKVMRRNADLSQRDICDNLGITDATLCRYETKERKPVDCRVLFRYCKLFGISDEIALEFYKILLNRESSLSYNDIKYYIDKKGQINELEVLKLGKYFLEERKNRKLTQRDVQSEIGLTPAEICRVETTKRELPTLNVIIPLCKFYNVSDDEFLEFYYKVMGIEKKKLYHINSDIEFLERTVKSQAVIIKEQQEMIEQLNKQLKLVRGK